MRTVYVSVPARRLSVAMLLAVPEMGCTTWIAEHQGAPSENSQESSGVGESPTANTTHEVLTTSSTSTPGGSLHSTGDLDSTTGTTSLPETSMSDPSTDSNPKPDVGGHPQPKLDMGDKPPDPACDGVYVEEEGEMFCVSYDDVRFVFVTSVKYNGVLPDPDAACLLAKGSPGALYFPGNYRAWISKFQNEPQGWDVQEGKTKRHVRYTTDGVGKVAEVVAFGWDGILNAGVDGGELENPINVDEFGKLVQNGEFVWTGTSAGGSSSGFNCHEWSSAGFVCDDFTNDSGSAGVVGELGQDWTRYIAGDGGCDATPHNRCVNFYRIYCIQVTDPG